MGRERLPCHTPKTYGEQYADPWAGDGKSELCTADGNSLQPLPTGSPSFEQPTLPPSLSVNSQQQTVTPISSQPDTRGPASWFSKAQPGV
jgi:hypothetical protein